MTCGTVCGHLKIILAFCNISYRGYNPSLFEWCCKSNVCSVVSEEVHKYHDSCRVRSRNHWRGLGPDRMRQDWGDSEEDSQRWLTPLFLTFKLEKLQEHFFLSLFLFLLLLFSFFSPSFAGLGLVLTLYWTNYSDSQRKLLSGGHYLRWFYLRDNFGYSVIHCFFPFKPPPPFFFSAFAVWFVAKLVTDESVFLSMFKPS